MTSAQHLVGGDLLPEQAPRNGDAGHCPWPGCTQPARWSRVDTRRRVPESIRVCFEHRAGDLSDLPPLREGNAGPVAATLAMMVVEHPEGWLLRDAGRALGVLPSEVARVAREVGLPVMHGRVWPAPVQVQDEKNREPEEESDMENVELKERIIETLGHGPHTEGNDHVHVERRDAEAWEAFIEGVKARREVPDATR